MITKFNKNRLFIFYLFFFFKYLSIIKPKFFISNNSFIKLNNKKNLFFKKKYSPKNLISKRLSIVFKKRKNINITKQKRVGKGNFFLKKFFFKILLKNRKSLKDFFFLNKKTRQLKVTKFIHKHQKNFFGDIKTGLENTILNILLRSNFFLFIKDALNFFKNNYIYLNGKVTKNFKLTLNKGDCLQLPISKFFFKYIKFSKKLLKKKTTIFKLSSWKFFKQKLLKKKAQFKLKKKKTPKYLYLFYLFKLNTPQNIEVDYFTMSTCLLYKNLTNYQPTYYLNKFFSFKLFSLYNFKKIN